MKNWYNSKTIWINLLVLVGSLISGITGENWLDGEAQLIALSVIDIILRKVTSQGIS